MQKRTVTITNRLGLHARAAARLVRLAAGFSSQVQISHCDSNRPVADAKSIFGVLLLAATQNTRLEVVADGSDEEAAIAAVCTLIEDQFGERSTTSQP
jgi:phosphocarrier protein HPr